VRLTAVEHASATHAGLALCCPGCVVRSRADTSALRRRPPASLPALAPRPRTGRDIDRIQDDIKALVAGKELPGIVDEDAPGGGKHYCVPCARHFTGEDVLKLHMRSKPHKKRLRLVAAKQYTHEEAAAGAGCSGRDV
jgi:hypothetical protein